MPFPGNKKWTPKFPLSVNLFKIAIKILNVIGKSYIGEMGSRQLYSLSYPALPPLTTDRVKAKGELERERGF